MQIKPLLLAEALYQATKDKKEVEVTTAVARFVVMLRERGWLPLLPHIISMLPEAMRKIDGVVSVSVETVHEIPEKVIRAAIAKFNLASTATEITHIKNPDLLGGIRIRTLNKIFDASVRGRLNTMRQTIN